LLLRFEVYIETSIISRLKFKNVVKKEAAYYSGLKNSLYQINE